jgi:hypothetical protein
MSDRLDVLTWLWLGAALLFAAVVAPAAFEVLPTRALAGLLVGRVLPVLFWSGAITGLIVVATRGGWRRGAALLMLGACVAAQLGVAPRIQRLRAELGPDIEAVSPSDARRLAFGRLHGVSVALLGVGMLGAVAIALGALAARAAAGAERDQSRLSASSRQPAAPAGSG